MSVALEKEFLKRIVESPEAMMKCVGMQVSKDLILDPINKKFFEVVSWYHQKYTQLPSEDSFKLIVEKSKFKDDFKQKLCLLFTELRVNNYEDRPVAFLVDTIREDFKKAQLKDLLITSVGSFESGKVDETVNSIKAGISKLELNSRSETREGFIHDSADERMKKYLDVRDHPENYKGIQTGWPSFDRITGGIRGSQLMVIIAAVKEGKSTALLNIGHNACAMQGKNVMYVSVEMKKEQVERRFDARDSMLSYSKIRDGRLSPAEQKQYETQIQIQRTRPGKFYVLDEQDCSAAFIKSKLSTSPHKFDLVVVDYLSLVKPSAPTKDLWQNIGNVALELRDIAREFNVPLVTAAQANRDGMKEAKYKYNVENVGLSHLISAHADTMLSLRFVDRDELEINDVVEMSAATIAIRDDRACRFTIDACFDKMSMIERELVLTNSAVPSFPAPPIPA